MLTAREEQILRAIYFYRYVTALDITYHQFARTSLNHAREILSRLAGNSDLDTHNYLCRFTLPAINRKPPEKVFVLGSKGRRVLQNMGLPATWYFRPHKLKFLSYSYVLHNLILTRTLIAAEAWAREHPAFTLTDKRIAYELTGKVIPDGWLMIEEAASDGVYEHPLLIELDRGMEFKAQFRNHVRGRINYIQSGEYKRTFKTDLATIVYVTTGQTEAYKTSRRKAMCGWITELLKDMRLENWAGVFRVASIEFGSLYDNALFEGEVWYRPDSSTAVRLFE